MHKNNPDDFPDLKLQKLEKYARRWREDFPDIPIERIILYEHHSKWTKYFKKKNPNLKAPRYVVVFEVNRLELKRYQKRHFHYTPDILKNLPWKEFMDEMDNVRRDAFRPQRIFTLYDRFEDVYRQPARDDFYKEWLFEAYPPGGPFLDHIDKEVSWFLWPADSKIVEGVELSDDPIKDSTIVVNKISIDKLAVRYESDKEIIREPEEAKAELIENKPIEKKTGNNEISNKIEINDGEKRRAAILIGDRWDVYFDGDHTHLNNHKRFQYVFWLLKNPNDKIFCVDLNKIISGNQPEVSKEYKETKKIYEEMSRDQLEEEGLTSDLDIIMKDTLSKNEIEGITKPIYDCWERVKQNKLNSKEEWERARKYLFNEYGIKTVIANNELKFKKPLTRLTPEANKARINVRNNIKNALDDIKDKMPALYKHLKNSIKTGIMCCYEVDQNDLVEWYIEWDN